MPLRSMREAEAIAGTLSRPSKMPGWAYGLPAQECLVGSLLRKIPGSVCFECYALKGRYMFPNVRAAQNRRLASLKHPQWVDALVFMIRHHRSRWFRWHDSGDLQGVWHLENIVAVCRTLPEINFWLPTRETKMVRKYLELHGAFPKNLCVRVSSAMIGGKPLYNFPNTSTVVADGSHTCHAREHGNKCGDCRACWSPRVANVAYPKH